LRRSPQGDQPDLDRRIDRPACEAGIAIARHARHSPDTAAAWLVDDIATARRYATAGKP
jgi:hypothetical protein